MCLLCEKVDIDIHDIVWLFGSLMASNNSSHTIASSTDLLDRRFVCNHSKMIIAAHVFPIDLHADG